MLQDVWLLFSQSEWIISEKSGYSMQKFVYDVDSLIGNNKEASPS